MVLIGQNADIGISGHSPLAKEKKLAYIVSKRQTQGHCESKKLWFFLLFTTIEVTKLKITLM